VLWRHGHFAPINGSPLNQVDSIVGTSCAAVKASTGGGVTPRFVTNGSRHGSIEPTARALSAEVGIMLFGQAGASPSESSPRAHSLQRAQGGCMTLILACSLGGSARRYGGGRLVRLTFLDPWARAHLEFESTRLPCLWLLRQADRLSGPVAVTTIATCNASGRNRQCLRWRDSEGQIVHEAVATDLHRAAALRAAGIRVTAWSSVLKRQTIWRNVDFLRMAAVQWLDVHLDWGIERLCDAVRAMPSASLKELRGMHEGLASLPEGRLHATVSHAWHQGLIDIDLAFRYSLASRLRPGVQGVGELR